MSEQVALNQTDELISRRKQLFVKIGFLGFAAILLSIGIIWFYNRVMYNEEIFELYNGLEIAGITLMPYLISASIAAITALAILIIIPAEKTRMTSQQVADRLRLLRNGDLVTFMRFNAEDTLVNDIAHELSLTVSQWNSMMSQLKIINRQQWDQLQEIKRRAAANDGESILLQVKKMEKNWEKTAEIEELIRT